MGFFSKKKTKRIHSTSVAASQVYENNRLEEIRIKNIIKKVKHNMSGQEYVMEYSKYGAEMLRNYNYRGRDIGSNTKIKATTVEIPKEEIKELLVLIEETEDIIFHSFEYDTPENTDWIFYQLQRLYGYNLTYSLCFIGDTFYTLKEIVPSTNFDNEDDYEEEEEEGGHIGGISPEFYDYDEDKDVFIVTLEAAFEKVEREYAVVTIVFNDDEGILEEPEEYPNHEINIIEQRYTFKDYIALLPIEGSESEVKEVLISSKSLEQTEVEKTMLIEEYLELENLTAIDIISEIVFPVIEDSIELELPAYDEHKKYFLVSYDIYSTGEEKVWIYDPASNEYPSLEEYSSHTVEYEAYPIVMLKTNGYGVDEYDGPDVKTVRPGNVNLQVYKPNILSPKLYYDTDYAIRSFAFSLDDLLESIKTNPDADALYEAYSVIGVSPSNKHSAVSKALFLTFEKIYDNLNMDLLKEGSPCILEVLEDTYNAKLTWIPESVYYTKGNFGEIDSCKHSINRTVKKEISYSITCTYEIVIYKDYSNWEGGPVPTETRYVLTEKPNNFPHTYVILKGSAVKGYYIEEVIQWVSIRTGDDTIAYPLLKKVDVELLEDSKIRFNYYNYIPKEEIFLQKQTTKTTIKNLKVVVQGKSSIKTFKGKWVESYFSIKKCARSGKYWNEYVGEKLAYNIWFSTITRDDRIFSQELPLTSSNLVIPLIHDIIKDFNLMEQVSLLGVSLHLVFYTYRYDKIRYYESTFFGSIIGVIAAVISIAIAVINAPAGLAIQFGALSFFKIATVMMVSMAVEEIVGAFINDPRLVSFITQAATFAAAAYVGAIDLSAVEFDLKFASDLVKVGFEVVNLFAGGDVNTQIKHLQEKTEKMWEIYQKRSDELAEKLTQLQTGLGPEFFAELNYGMVEYDSTPTSPYLYSPDFVRYVMLDMYKDIDLLYRNPIETLIQNKLQIGILDI